MKEFDGASLLGIDIEDSQTSPKCRLCTPLHGSGGSAGMVRIWFQWLGCAA